MKNYKVTITMQSSVEISVEAENREQAEERAYEILNESEDKRAEMLDSNNSNFYAYVNEERKKTYQELLTEIKTKEKGREILEKEFAGEKRLYPIRRKDFEELPDPMIALELDDGKMQEIAEETDKKAQKALTESEIEIYKKYREAKDRESEEKYYKGKEIEDILFSIAEETAVIKGMRYYEDLEDSEYEKLLKIKTE